MSQVSIPLTTIKATVSKRYNLQEVMDGNNLDRNAVIARLLYIDTNYDDHEVAFSAEGKAISGEKSAEDYHREIVETADAFTIHVK